MTDQATPPPEHEIILEPGDPGYVAPSPPAGAPGQDLVPVRDPREHEAEFLARTRNQVVDSTSPTDIVPNQPQIRFSEQNPPEPEAQP